jgi:hypothetical protein
VNGARQYTAAGDLWMNWNFAQRTGAIEISNFDNRNFSGGLEFEGTIGAAGSGAMYDATRFSGGISGAIPDAATASGLANGSFVNDSAGNAARGVIGNFSVGNGAGYTATGIFAGSGTPGIPLN